MHIMGSIPVNVDELEFLKLLRSVRIRDDYEAYEFRGKFYVKNVDDPMPVGLNHENEEISGDEFDVIYAIDTLIEVITFERSGDRHDGAPK